MQALLVGAAVLAGWAKVEHTRSGSTWHRWAMAATGRRLPLCIRAGAYGGPGRFVPSPFGRRCRACTAATNGENPHGKPTAPGLPG